MEHSFFVSQNEQDYYSRFTCGVASMMMLLSYHKLNLGFSFVQLADELRLAVPPMEKGYKETDPQIGVYPEDVFRFLYKQDIPFRMSFYEEEWEACLLDGPIMAMVSVERDGEEEDEDDCETEAHWVVLIRKEENNFYYLDPWYTSDSEYCRVMSQEDFFASYTGIACQIIAQTDSGEVGSY